MSAVDGKPEAGGPQFFLSETFAETQSALDALLPELDNTGTSLTFDGTNEQQTVSITGTPTGGTFKLAFNGAETGDLAHNIAAAALKTALEALITIGSGNVNVTGSNPNFTVTFQGDLAARNQPMLTKDATGLTGGTSPNITIAETVQGKLDNWTELPDITDESTMKVVEESEDIVPLHLLWRQSDVVTMRGIEEITFNYSRRGVDDLKTMLEVAVKTAVAAGASQVGQSVLTYGSLPAANTYRHLLGVMRNHRQMWTAMIIPKVRVIGGFDLTFGHSVTKIPSKFKVFAHPGLAENANLLQMYEMTAVKTS